MQVCRQDALQRARFLKVVYSLLESPSAAVRYEAANTLAALSSRPTAVRAAANTYVDIVVTEPDNSIKLIVLGRLEALCRDRVHERVLNEVVMDILRVLAAQDLEVRRKTLDISLTLVSPKSVGEVIAFLKKELTKSLAEVSDFERAAEYRQLLVRAVHRCTVKFPDVVTDTVPMLMDFLSDQSGNSAYDVAMFVREAVERFPDMHTGVVRKLLEMLPQIREARVLSAALWLAGEYAATAEQVGAALDAILALLGELPIVETELRAAAKLAEEEQAGGAKATSAADAPPAAVQTRIAPDGTYVTQVALTMTKGRDAARNAAGNPDGGRPALRALLLGGNFAIGALLAATLTKLAARYRAIHQSARRRDGGGGGGGDAAFHKFAARCMLPLASILHLGRSGLPAAPIDSDSAERIMLCIRVLADPDLELELADVFLSASHAAYVDLLRRTGGNGYAPTVDAGHAGGTGNGTDVAPEAVQVDSAIVFRQLRARGSATTDEDELEADLTRATGRTAVQEDAAAGAGVTKLNRIVQLTGFGDPVYAEAYLTANQYDIVLDVLLVNQTADTLQNLQIELSAKGDLKLVERPQQYTLAPRDFTNVKATIKVASTNTGLIFGNIVYDVSGRGNERSYIVLNSIRIDIIDYIEPATCTDEEFRAMWLEFEWENSLPVSSFATGLAEYVQHIVAITNMRCLTPIDSTVSEECAFLSVNLYARSAFGEAALANLSLEHSPAANTVTGTARIRSKTQGIAISLGEKIKLYKDMKK